MKENIQKVLTDKFEKNRIVFWHDSKRELRQDFEQAEISGVEKIELKNNEFRVKYKILREKPDEKFLLYREGEEPSVYDNWLLDVQLYSGRFSADQSDLILDELGLGIEFANIVKDHHFFFNSSKRVEKFKKNISSEDRKSEKKLKTKMLGVCACSDSRIEDVLERLLCDLAYKKNDKLKLIENSCLDSFFWERLGEYYGYNSQSQGIKDFAILLFKSSYELSLFKNSDLNSDALVFLKRFKNNIRNQDAFEILSKEYVDIIGIETDLEKRDISELLEIDFFEIVDKKILSELVAKVSEKTITSSEVDDILRSRKLTHWYKNYEDIYLAAYYGFIFLRSFEEIDFYMESVTDAVNKYASVWHTVDRLYRKYISHSSKSAQVSILQILTEKVNNFYVNNILFTLNNNFQKHVESCKDWSRAYKDFQRDFFKKKVKPFCDNNKKIVVIISDALRYEIASEISMKISSEDRFQSEITPMLSVLPSYTQLGMAALLPNKEIELSKSNLPNIIVDGISSV
ncbi:MAG: BREX-1 system phosphatase PglZ type A, partial [Candidatus Muiribacteriota bacterium]